jgi:hypothetical protein
VLLDLLHEHIVESADLKAISEAVASIHQSYLPAIAQALKEQG